MSENRDQALWRAATRDVKPLRQRGTPKPVPRPPGPAKRNQTATSMPDLASMPSRAAAADSLDRGWQKRIRRGQLTPERSLDLHGLRREPAYRRLMTFIGSALTAECRVVLVITGKGRPGAPSLLRQSVPDWLSASPYAPAIMAVRAAHPSHGGAGALYIILRRGR